MDLHKEDYEEPCCPLQKPDHREPLPIRRIIEKLDEDLGHNDYDAARRHLDYWLAEADAVGDLRGKLSLLNETVGLYRKLGMAEQSLSAAEAAPALAKELGLEHSVTMGTTLVNSATAYKAFGQPERALPLYEQARALYEHLLPRGDSRLGGLYNNMALALADLGRFQDAKALYAQALTVMAQVENGAQEQAITWCNLADLAAAELGPENGEARINDCLEHAETLLNVSTLPRDGYHAFVCEKCAPTFGHYGWFLTEQALLRRAEQIYHRI